VPAKAETHRYIVLPDGSKVLLNSGSQLDYPAAFNGRRREVYLRGEGYFDIKHDAHRPFIVHAGKIKTVVLGTAFDIKAFAGQDKVVVTVTRGKVRVENEHATLGILTPNEQLTVSDQNEAPAKQLVKTEEVMRWKADDVLFDDIPLSEAVAELEKRFPIRIVLENPALGNCRVTASFLHQETAEAIIGVLCGINHMQYRNTGDHITLSGEGCR
jgi:ferric-dicitrate binding protein FerR (iron transport regulator)